MDRKILIDLVKRQTETFNHQNLKPSYNRTLYRLWLLSNTALSLTSFQSAKQNLTALKIILEEVTLLKNSRGITYLPKSFREDVSTLKSYLEDYITNNSNTKTD